MIGRQGATIFLLRLSRHLLTRANFFLFGKSKDTGLSGLRQRQSRSDRQSQKPECFSLFHQVPPSKTSNGNTLATRKCSS
jgi:hypothetical protein